LHQAHAHAGLGPDGIYMALKEKGLSEMGLC
jgi:hypothetical protein